jgi:hypothetical protein
MHVFCLKTAAISPVNAGIGPSLCVTTAICPLSNISLLGLLLDAVKLGVFLSYNH